MREKKYIGNLNFIILKDEMIIFWVNYIANFTVYTKVFNNKISIDDIKD